MTMRRWSGVAGILFVALAVISPLIRGSVPGTDKADAMAKFARYYADSSHQSQALASAITGIIGLFFFAWFLGGLWSLLREAEGAPATPTIIVAVGGAAFIALGALEHVVHNTIGITLHFSDGYRLDPGLALVLEDLGTGIFLASMLAVGAATAAAGFVILRTRVLPVWLAWVGFLIAVLALPVIPPLSFLGALVLALWALVVSLLLLRPAP